MKVFTPFDQTPFPIQRGDAILHRILKRGEPYLLTEAAGLEWQDLLSRGLVRGRMEDAEERPITPGKHNLIHIDGDLGDALVVRPTIAAMCEKRPVAGEVGFVTPNGDWSLLPFSGCPVFEFPATLRQAQCFDGWGEFNFRLDRHANVFQAFGDLFGVKVKEPVWTLPIPSLAGAVGDMLPNTGRPRIGLSVRTRSHYRSWYGQHACVVAAGLVEAGFDCFFVGPLDHRVEFRREGEEFDLWGDGMYDLQGKLASVEEHVALLSNMDAIVCPDGGDLMIAAALQKPTLGLFWCTDSKPYLPMPTVTAMHADKECAPCHCLTDRPPCDSPYCLAIARLDPETIVKAVANLLEGQDATPTG